MGVVAGHATSEQGAAQQGDAVRAPAVSVVMSVYNGERYLAQAIESILHQTFEDFEFIIIDDGSSDRSRQIVEAYATRDARIHLISRPNTGLTKALNEGIARSRAPLVARMDADDVALPERFEAQVAYMHEHPECVALGTRVLVIDSEGAPVCEMGKLTDHEAIESALLESRGQMLFHPSMMFRRAALERVSGYAEKYRLAQDLALFLRLAQEGRLANLPQVLLHYREHLQKLGHATTDEQQKTVLTICNEARERRGMPPLSQSKPRHVGSVAQRYLVWGWWALREGHIGTARKYARRSLLRSPWTPEAWRLAFCACRGR